MVGLLQFQINGDTFMFLASRIFNGLVAVVCFVMAVVFGMTLFQGLTGAAASAIQSAILFMMTPVLLFAVDIIFCKKGSHKTKFFTLAWVLFYGYSLSFTVLRLYPNDTPTRSTDADVVTLTAILWTSIVIFGLPLLVNGIHLFQQMMRRKAVG